MAFHVGGPLWLSVNPPQAQALESGVEHGAFGSALAMSQKQILVVSSQCLLTLGLLHCDTPQWQECALDLTWVICNFKSPFPNSLFESLPHPERSALFPFNGGTWDQRGEGGWLRSISVLPTDLMIAAQCSSCFQVGCPMSKDYGTFSAEKG